MSHLPRRGECTPVPAIRPKRTAAPHEAIDRKRDANRDTSHAFGQSSLIARFDDEVHVIPLHGKVKDAEAERSALGSAAEGQAHGRKDVLAAERAKSRTQRDVDGMSGRVIWTSAVWNGPSPGCRLAPGAGTPAAPGFRECELLLHGAPLAALPGMPARDSSSAPQVQSSSAAVRARRLHSAGSTCQGGEPAAVSV